MKVIITGGAGFIGSNIADELLKHGHEVKVIDDLSTGKKENVNCHFVKGSITDLGLLKKEFAGFDAVLHLAAIASVPQSLKDPLKTEEVNARGTLNVLIVARDSGIKRVIYSSSTAVYGNSLILPKRETMRPEPASPYAATKLAGEHYCRIFAQIYGMETISLRYFNVFGPRQRPDSEYAAVVPIFIKAALDSSKPVIFGDGNQTRDFVYITDVVNANILSLKAKSLSGEAINIASGQSVTINKVFDLVCNVTLQRIEPERKDERPGDIKHSQADITLAKKIIGYSPLFRLEEGLKKTIEWHKANKN